MKPYLIVITGRPGAGKTTLAERLSREWYLPLLCRDRIKEGLVHTLTQDNPSLPDEANLMASDACFAALESLLNSGISCILEAAYSHKIWSQRLPALADKAQIHMIICRISGHLSVKRILARCQNEPERIRYHNDTSVLEVMQGLIPTVRKYAEPHFPFPTYYLDTSDGYSPSLDELRREIFPSTR